MSKFKHNAEYFSTLIIIVSLLFFSFSFILLDFSEYILFCGVVIVLIFVLFKPLYGLSVLSFSIPFAGVMQVGKQMTANKIFAIYVMTSFFVGLLIKNEKIDFFSSKTLNMYIFFHFWLLVSFSFGNIFIETLQGFFSPFYLLGLVILVAAIPKDFQEFKVICMSAAIGSCSLGIYTAMFGMGSLVGRYGTRLAAGTNENVLAHALAVGLLLSFFALQNSRRSVKGIIFILDFFTIYAIFLTGSRGTWIALIVSVIFFPLFAQNIPIKKRLTYVLLGSVVVFTVLFGLANNYFGKWGQLIRGRLSEHDSITQAAGGRLDTIWPFYLDKFYENPLSGWGAGFSHDIGMAVHNDFLNIMVETGIVGLLIYLVFLLFALKEILHNKDATLRLQSLILLSFLLISGFTHDTIPLKSYALAVGALCFLAKLSRQETQ